MKKIKLAVLILVVLVIVETIFLVFLLVRRPKKGIVKIPFPRAQIIKGKIAIVIDDWGYNFNNIRFLDGFKFPLTVSILPNLNYSHLLSEDLYQRGFEVILHLPMEPEDNLNIEKDTIMVSMDETAVKEIVSRGFSSVSHSKGLSNHMGSKAVADKRIMSVILDELKRNGFYFLDSFVSSDSVGGDLAKIKQVLFAKRDIFLDNQNDPKYIKGQIYKLKMKAAVNGQAIGIGHDRKLTLEILKEVMPQLEKEGYKFVFVSDLAR